MIKSFKRAWLGQSRPSGAVGLSVLWLAVSLVACATAPARPDLAGSTGSPTRNRADARAIYSDIAYLASDPL